LPPESGLQADATLSRVQFATGAAPFSQYDADLLRVGDELVVAWTDSSDASTGPDIRYRTFAATGSGEDRFPALEDERVLAESSSFEGNVALAPFGTSWVAAFRASAGVEETVEVVAPGEELTWSIGPHLPGATEDRPAVAELDVDHLLVLFSVGTDPEGTGSAQIFRLHAAVLDRSSATPIAVVELPPLDPAYAALTVSQSHPSLVKVGDVLFAAYRASSLVADANAEDTFIQTLVWESGALTAPAERAIPRLPEGSLGDQRFPALAVGPRQLGTPGLPEPAPFGALVVAWDDYLADGDPAQGQPDVLVQHWPLPVLGLDGPPAECGDGVVQAGAGETCDDGNEVDTDACPTTCLVAACGDGYVRAGTEECDPGPPPGDPACNTDCTLPACGYLPGDPTCATGEFCDDDGECKTRPCSVNDPFISLTSVFADTVRAEGMTFSADGLTVYASVGTVWAGYDIQVATRATTAAPFGSFSAVPGIPTGWDQLDPWLSRDGLELYYSTTNTSNGDPDILRVTRSTPTGTFGNVTSLSVNQIKYDRDPYFAPGQATLFFASERSTNDTHLWTSTYSGGTFATPVALTTVNHAFSQDGDPVPTRDALRLYFRSRRSAVSHPNVGADGDGDIYVADRSSTSLDFGTPTLINILNSTGIDYPVGVSADGCSLFVASNRHTGNSDVEIFRIYEARRGTAPQNVTITMKVYGDPGDSVGAPFNCSAGSTCTVTQAYGTYANPVYSSSGADWSGACFPRGSPGQSSDGVVLFGADPICTVQFP
jgi:cysteine-rich repeat protein